MNFKIFLGKVLAGYDVQHEFAACQTLSPPNKGIGQWSTGGS